MTYDRFVHQWRLIGSAVALRIDLAWFQEMDIRYAYYVDKLSDRFDRRWRAAN
jgi:hypothetical protein